MDDLGFVALLLELLLLAACASLCASFVDILTEASTAQERLQWRRLSTVAASTAAAATEEVIPSPSPATVQVTRVAAQAASAATITALAQDQMDLASAPWVAAASADHAGGGEPAGRDQHADVVRGRGGVGRGRGGAGRGWGVVRLGVERPRSGEGRKPRTPISLGDKLAILEIRDAGHTCPQTLAMFRLNISVSAARAINKNMEEFRRRAAASEDLSGTRQRRSYSETVSQGLRDWYQATQRVGGPHLPVSGRLLEARARRIATKLCVTGFKRSPHLSKTGLHATTLTMGRCEVKGVYHHLVGGGAGAPRGGAGFGRTRPPPAHGPGVPSGHGHCAHTECGTVRCVQPGLAGRSRCGQARARRRLCRAASAPSWPRHRPPRQAEAPGPDSPSSFLAALGDLFATVFRCIGWSAARANSH